LKTERANKSPKNNVTTLNAKLKAGKNIFISLINFKVNSSVSFSNFFNNKNN